MTMLTAQIGSLNWLSMNCRMNLAYGSHELSKIVGNVTIKDLKFSNAMVRRAVQRQNKVIYRSVGKPEDLVVYAFSDSSYNMDGKSTGGR